MSSECVQRVMQDDRLFGFFDNVLRTADARRFQALVQQLSQQDQVVSYQSLADRIHEVMPGGLTLLMRQVRSLWSLQRDMGQQAATLLKDQREKPYNGYVEIGYPGRFVRTFRSALNVKGDVALVDEKEPSGVTDRIQFGFPYTNPSQKFIALGDYALDVDAIGHASRDLVSCLIGLHHCHEERLGQFLSDIKTILRPGGIFLLRDHDCSEDGDADLAQAAHTVFNLANGVTAESEQAEVRNFASMRHWVDVLENAGFEQIADDKPVQEVAGDPTKNRMIAFRRRPENLEELKVYLKTLPQYQRGPEKTYLTRVEWHNVDLAQQLADCGPQWTRFAYLHHGVQQWQEFGRAWRSSQQRYGFWKTLTSDHTLMNVFICVMNTFESLYRAMLALICRVLSLNSSTPSAVDKAVATLNKDYAEWVTETPFYQFPVWSNIAKLWRAWLQNIFSWQVLKDLVAVVGLTLELSAKGLISLPMRWMFGSGSLKEPEQLQVLVKSDAAIAGARGHWEFEEQHYNLVDVNRYMQFKGELNALASEGREILEVSGNDTVQVKLKSCDVEPLHIEGAEFESSCKIIADPAGNRYDYYAVKLPYLRQFLDAGKAVEYIHDF